MSFDYGGKINQQNLKVALGFEGKVNPIAYVSGIKDEIKRTLEIRERSQFVRRYRWVNTPKGFDANLMERILYYRGRVVLFKIGEEFYHLPFALNGTIDAYGRYKSVTPLTFNGTVKTDDKGENYMGDGVLLNDLTLNVLYDMEDDTIGKDAVILNDYTQGISEFIIPRYQLNQIYHSELANIVVLIKHNLVSSARVYTVRVLDEGQKNAVLDEFANMEQDIINHGKRIFAVTSQTKLEEILKDKVLDTQEYWQCYVSLDNLRENLLGIENNGIFKKKERQLKGEQELEASSADLVYQDGLYNRQQMCQRFNALFGTDMWVEESEVISGHDIDEDGDIDDEEVEKGVEMDNA